MVLRDTCPAYLPPSSTHISPLLISRQCGGALSTSRSATLSPNVRHDWHHWLSSLLSRRLRARASLASLLSLVGRLFGERTRVSKSRAFAWPSVSHGLVLNLSSASGIRREGDAPLSVVLVLLVLRPPRCVALKVRKVLLSGKDVTATDSGGGEWVRLARLASRGHDVAVGPARRASKLGLPLPSRG